MCFSLRQPDVCQSQWGLLFCSTSAKQGLMSPLTRKHRTLHTHTHTHSHVNNPCVCDKWAGHRLWKLHIQCSCGLANSWHWAVGLCPLSASLTSDPASSSPMLPWNRPVIITAVSLALCQGESGKDRGRERGRERASLKTFKGGPCRLDCC